MAATLYKLVETYSLRSGAERAQTSLWFLSPTGMSIADAITATQTPRNTRWGVQKALHASSTGYLSSRMYLCDINTGHVIASQDAGVPASLPGTGGADTIAVECAHVLTLRTDFDTRRSRGRIYLPPVATTQMTTLGDIGPTTAANFATFFATFFADVIAAAGDFVPVVYSRADVACTPITSVDMGSIVDVQRSRRRSLVETRASAVV